MKICSPYASGSYLAGCIRFSCRYAPEETREDNTAPPRNFTLTGGMAAFIEAVAALENVTVYTETEAVDIAKDGEKYIVETHCGKKYTADNVTLACPPIFAGKLLANIAPPDVSELLNQIPAVKVETVGVIVNKSDVSVDNFSFIIAKDDDFTSAVSRDIIPHDKYRGFAFHFRGGDKLDKEGKITKMEDVLGIDRGGAIISSAETVHYSPTLGMDHKERITQIDEKLKNYKGIRIVGNYFGGIAIEDCALRAAIDAD